MNLYKYRRKFEVFPISIISETAKEEKVYEKEMEKAACGSMCR